MKKVMKKIKSGFTLVELVVVIAIIAILGTVSVVGYFAFIEKAEQSNDESIVTQLNTLLEANEAMDGKPETMTEVVDLLEENGFLLDNLTPSNAKNEFVWDSVNNEFVIVKVSDLLTDPLAKTESWIIVDDEDALTKYSTKYSAYLANAFIESGDGNLTVTNGLDTGKYASPLTINYTGDTAKAVKFNTTKGTLNINAIQDNVSHYGNIDYVNIEAVASQSYHEFGNVTANLSIKKGRVELENESTITKLTIDTNVAEDFDITVNNGATLTEVTIAKESNSSLTQDQITAITNKVNASTGATAKVEEFIAINTFEELYQKVASYNIYDANTKTVNEHVSEKGVYKLMNDLIMTKMIKIKNFVTIDLNGHCITMTKARPENDLITWATTTYFRDGMTLLELGVGVCFDLTEIGTLTLLGKGIITHDESYKDTKPDVVDIPKFCELILKETGIESTDIFAEHWGYDISKPNTDSGPTFEPGTPSNKLQLMYADPFSYYTDMIGSEESKWKSVKPYACEKFILGSETCLIYNSNDVLIME